MSMILIHPGHGSFGDIHGDKGNGSDTSVQTPSPILTANTSTC